MAISRKIIILTIQAIILYAIYTTFYLLYDRKTDCVIFGPQAISLNKSWLEISTIHCNDNSSEYPELNRPFSYYSLRYNRISDYGDFNIRSKLMGDIKHSWHIGNTGITTGDYFIKIPTTASTVCTFYYFSISTFLIWSILCVILIFITSIVLSRYINYKARFQVISTQSTT